MHLILGESCVEDVCWEAHFNYHPQFHLRPHTQTDSVLIKINIIRKIKPKGKMNSVMYLYNLELEGPSACLCLKVIVLVKKNNKAGWTQVPHP